MYLSTLDEHEVPWSAILRIAHPFVYHLRQPDPLHLGLGLGSLFKWIRARVRSRVRGWGGSRARAN